MTTVFVTTAGKVGATAARLLVQDGTPVRILTRNPVLADTLTKDGADVVEGDLDDPDVIGKAVQGIDSMILVSPAVPAQEIRLIQAAQRAGVGHIVKVTSPASPESPIARQRGQAEIETVLERSGTPFTLLRNNFYMQNFFLLAPGISATSSFGSSAGAGRVGFVDTRDVAAVAARIAAAPTPHAGRTYALTGPELLSYADVAQILTRVLGRPISFQERTVEQDIRSMTQAGVPEAVAAMNAQAVHAIAEGSAAWLSNDVETVLARPATSFERFAVDHAARLG